MALLLKKSLSRRFNLLPFPSICRSKESVMSLFSTWVDHEGDDEEELKAMYESFLDEHKKHRFCRTPQVKEQRFQVFKRALRNIAHRYSTHPTDPSCMSRLNYYSDVPSRRRGPLPNFIPVSQPYFTDLPSKDQGTIQEELRLRGRYVPDIDQTVRSVTLGVTSSTYATPLQYNELQEQLLQVNEWLQQQQEINQQMQQKIYKLISMAKDKFVSSRQPDQEDEEDDDTD